MSYMRPVSILDWFFGMTQSYVIGTTDNNGEEIRIEDWGDQYEDNASFIELIGTFIKRECGDEEYADKVVRILAKKLGCSDKLRPKKLSWKEFEVERASLTKSLQFGEIAMSSLQIIQDSLGEGLSDNKIISLIEESRGFIETIRMYRNRAEDE